MGEVSDPFGLVGAVHEQRFAVERVVARGGFGVVYRAMHLALRRPVALKVLFVPPHLAPEQRGLFLDGFAQEAQVIAGLDHPAIVRVFDFGVARAPDGRDMPWMVLEWIEGRTFADFLKERGGRPMEPAEALDTLRPVLQALAFAHTRRVAHRDVKPANIMLVGEPSVAHLGQVGIKVLDFGIAKVMNPDEGVGSGETQTDALFSAFSLPYAAPEQRAGMRTGPWTDVHALGLILTEMLTGERPYGNGDRVEVEFRVLSPVRPTPAFFHRDVGAWEAVLAKAVALRPPDRFQDAGALLAALEASVCPAPSRPRPGEPSAPPPTVFAPPPLPLPPPRHARRGVLARMDALFESYPSVVPTVVFVFIVIAFGALNALLQLFR